MSDAPELNAIGLDQAIECWMSFVPPDRNDIDDDDEHIRYVAGENVKAAVRAYLAALREAPVAWQIGEDGALYATKAAADKHVAGWAAKNIVCGPVRPLYASPANEAGAPVAVKKAFFEGFSAGEASGKFGDDTDSDAWDRYALTHPQALTASPVEAPVAVKALGWRKGYCDETVTTHQAASGGLYQVRVLDGGIWLDWPDKPATEFATVDEAKAAAQTDFEARIRSALTASPASHGVVTDAMAEKFTAGVSKYWQGRRSGRDGDAILAGLSAALAPALVEQGVETEATNDIPYADEVVARTYAAIDALISKHADKARQALEKPVLQGWFAGQIMKQFDGYGDFASICQMVAERLAAAPEQEKSNG